MGKFAPIVNILTGVVLTAFNLIDFCTISELLLPAYLDQEETSV